MRLSALCLLDPVPPAATIQLSPTTRQDPLDSHHTQHLPPSQKKTGSTRLREASRRHLLAQSRLGDERVEVPALPDPDPGGRPELAGRAVAGETTLLKLLLLLVLLGCSATSTRTLCHAMDATSRPSSPPKENAQNEDFDDDAACLEYFHRWQTVKSLQKVGGR